MSRTPSPLGAAALGLVGVGLIGAAAARTQGSTNALTRREREQRLEELLPDKKLHWVAYSTAGWGNRRYATSFPSATLAHLWSIEMDKDDHYKRVDSLQKPTNRHHVQGWRPLDHHWLRPDGNLSQDYAFARGLGGRRRLMFNDIKIPIELFPDTVRTRIKTVLLAEQAMRDSGADYMTSDEAKVAAMQALAQRAMGAEAIWEKKELFDELTWFSTSYKATWPRRND